MRNSSVDERNWRSTELSLGISVKWFIWYARWRIEKKYTKKITMKH